METMRVQTVLRLRPEWERPAEDRLEAGFSANFGIFSTNCAFLLRYQTGTFLFYRNLDQIGLDGCRGKR